MSKWIYCLFLFFSILLFTKCGSGNQEELTSTISFEAGEGFADFMKSFQDLQYKTVDTLNAQGEGLRNISISVVSDAESELGKESTSSSTFVVYLYDENLVKAGQQDVEAKAKKRLEIVAIKLLPKKYDAYQISYLKVGADYEDEKDVLQSFKFEKAELLPREN